MASRVRLALIAGLSVALLTGGSTGASGEPAERAVGAAPGVGAALTVASGYTPLTPARVLDTRTGAGPVGPGQTINLDLSARVPAGTTAVVLNVTGTGGTAATYLTVFPLADPRPTVSNLNLVPGQTRPNLVTVVLGTDRRLGLYNNAGSVHLIADLSGYYSADGRSKYTPLEAERVFDTRWWHTPLGPGERRTVDLSGRIPASATAVTLNLTATEPTAATYVTAWPTGPARPLASNLNVVAGETAPNLVTVAVGTGRQINLYNNSGQVHLLADLAGFYTPAYGALFTAVTPTRVFDTRTGRGTYDGLPGPIGARVNKAVRPGVSVPDVAIAAVINLIGIAPTTSTFVTAWQNTYGYGPRTSNLNLVAGQTASNLATVLLSGRDPYSRFYVYNNAGSVHVAGDLAGYFWVPQQACTAGCLYSWGPNHYQLGTGTTIPDSPVPSPVHGLTGVVAMARTYAATSDGSVWAWGTNISGELGNGWYGKFGSTVPVPVLGLSGVTALAGTEGSNGNSGFALRSDGAVWAWGSNSYGKLGNGSTDNSPVPVRVPALSGVTAIAGGAATGYALLSNGTVWSWGSNANGQLGNSSTAAESRVPVRVSGLTDVTAIASNGGTAYALRSDGTAWSWGANGDGQLGNGVQCDPDTQAGCLSRVPVRVSATSGLSDVTAIAAGYNNGYALRADGTVWAWGSDWRGALGDGTGCGALPRCVSTLPIQVHELTGATAIAGFYGGGYALLGSGDLWAWGNNQDGELGRPDILGSSAVPVQTGLTGVTAIGVSRGGRALVPLG